MRFMRAEHKHGPVSGPCTSRDNIRQNFRTAGLAQHSGKAVKDAKKEFMRHKFFPLTATLPGKKKKNQKQNGGCLSQTRGKRRPRSRLCIIWSVSASMGD